MVVYPRTSPIIFLVCDRDGKFLTIGDVGNTRGAVIKALTIVNPLSYWDSSARFFVAYLHSYFAFLSKEKSFIASLFASLITPI